MTIMFSWKPPRSPGAATIGQLFRECPAEFKDRANPWYELAELICRHRGANTLAWKVKVTAELRDMLENWLTYVTIESTEPMRQRVVVAAWILSVMLEPPTPPFVAATQGLTSIRTSY